MFGRLWANAAKAAVVTKTSTLPITNSIILKPSFAHPQRNIVVHPERLAWVKSLQGENVGLVELHDTLFGCTPRTDILHKVVTWQLAKRRAGTASTKRLKEVRGSTRKPFPQKGRGRARHGSIRSMIFVGGAKPHGPKPRDYGYTLPKQVRALGLRVALSVKYAQGDLLVVDRLVPETFKTKEMADAIENHGLHSALFVGGRFCSRNLRLGLRNLTDTTKCLPAGGINVYDILHKETLVLSLSALERLHKRFNLGKVVTSLKETKELFNPVEEVNGPTPRFRRKRRRGLTSS
eukprot:Colp12_sorted_trinity150504_noHs@575